MKNVILFLSSFGLMVMPLMAQNKIIQPWGLSGEVWDGSKALGNNPSSENFYNDMRMKFAKLGEEVKLTLNDIDGTIYLDENFGLGTLYDNGVAFKKLQARYDAYNDELEIKETDNAKNVQALVKNSYLSCSLNGDRFVFSKMIDENDLQQNGYLILKYQGEQYALFERRAKLFKEGKPAKTSHSTSFPHRFIDQSDYYVVLDGATPKFLKPKKTAIISIFGEGKEQAIKKFIRDKGLNITEQKDLIDLFVYGNTLE